LKGFRMTSLVWARGCSFFFASFKLFVKNF
jgi:hypothetical protein